MATSAQGIEVQSAAVSAPADTGTDVPGGSGRAAALPARLAIAAMGVVFVLLLGAGIVLWMRHGVAIFFDTVAAGLATCF